VVLHFLLLHENAGSEPSTVAGRLVSRLEINIELFFSTWTCLSSDLYGQPILLESYARMLSFSAQTASDLHMGMTSCGRIAQALQYHGMVSVELPGLTLGLPAPCISEYACLLFDPLAMHGCFHLDPAEIIRSPFSKSSA
jgi:hypothetical protein